MSERHAKACQAGALALDRIKIGTGAATLLRELQAHFLKPRAAKQPKSDFATLKDEITRKALQAIQDAAEKHEAGLYTERDVFVAMDSVYDAISGLVDWEIADLVYRARQEMKGFAPK